MVAKVVKEKLEKDGQGVFYKSLRLAGLDAKPRRSVDWEFEDKGRLYVTIWDITTFEKNGVVQAIIPVGKWIRNVRILTTFSQTNLSEQTS